MTERRILKPEEKLRIVLEGMSGTIQVSELCRKHGINTRQFYIWKKKLISSGEIFSERGRKRSTLISGALTVGINGHLQGQQREQPAIIANRR